MGEEAPCEGRRVWEAWRVLEAGCRVGEERESAGGRGSSRAVGEARRGYQRRRVRSRHRPMTRVWVRGYGESGSGAILAC